MRRRLALLAAGLLVAVGLTMATADAAAADVPSPTGFCKKGIEAGTPPPPGSYWVIQSATFVQYEPTHLMAKCVRTLRVDSSGFLRCTQYVTLWWNGLWTFGALDCDFYSTPN